MSEAKKNAEDLDMKSIVNLLLDLEAIDSDHSKQSFIDIILKEGYVNIDQDAEALYDEAKEIHLYEKCKKERKEAYNKFFGEKR